MNLEGMSLSTLMPFVIKVAKFYLPSTIAIFVGIHILLKLVKLLGLLNIGNLPKNNLPKEESVHKEELKGKNMIFLGSSVTKGFAAYGRSFADMIAERNGTTCIKEAVSGTTLVEVGTKNYVTRMKAIDKNTPCDVFVCQLSTNDATHKKPLGTVAEGKALQDFDTKTVCGAIEYIIAYAKETWNCPVVFYTSPQYTSLAYWAMREALKQIAAKWNISVIDLWPNAVINEKKNKKFTFMNDEIHPTRRGYTLWTPIFEAALADVLAGKQVGFGVDTSNEAAVRKAKSSKTVKKVIKNIFLTFLIVLLIVITIALRFFGGVTYPTDGNDPKYLPENQTALEYSPLQGKTILSIGSSVSYGNGSSGVSFEDYLEVLDGATVIPVTEGATTIAIREGLTSSYTERLHRAVQPDWEIDAVILQVSTNDASAGNGIGEPTDSYDIDSFDLTTTSGGLEYLIAYCTETWNCPVVVYCSSPFENGPLYDADAYSGLVEGVHKVIDKWSSQVEITFIDQWNDPEMRSISEDELIHYMTDPVHPAMAGYLEWWMPNFQEALYSYFE